VFLLIEMVVVGRIESGSSCEQKQESTRGGGISYIRGQCHKIFDIFLYHD
jgi:hypothetical protein